MTAASASPVAGAPLLEVRGLTKLFPIRAGLFGRARSWVRAVEDVGFTVGRGETYALVGESGCGKTTTGRLALRLLDPTAGEIRFDGRDLARLSPRALRPFRRRMSVVFQDPQASLNPRMTVGETVGEGLLLHRPDLDDAARAGEVERLLGLVGLPVSAAERYPHAFSGGQRQRVGIARALAPGPEFIVCDEAVSALDVSIQAQIVTLLEALRDRLGLAYLFISHDLAVVRHIARRVGVMYLGRIVEEGDADEVFSDPLHPYTRALLSAAPEPDPSRRRRRIALPGGVPRPDRPPPGCGFHPRCPDCRPECRAEAVPEISPRPGRLVRCALYAARGRI